MRKFYRHASAFRAPVYSDDVTFFKLELMDVLGPCPHCWGIQFCKDVLHSTDVCFLGCRLLCNVCDCYVKNSR